MTMNGEIIDSMRLSLMNTEDYMYKSFYAGTKRLFREWKFWAVLKRMVFQVGQNEYGFRWFLSNFDYSYADRYLLQGSVRTDESSKFTPAYSRGWFWGVSAGWNLHNESFTEILAIR